MSRSTLLLLVVAVPTALLVGCGDDTGTGTTGTGGSTETSTSATGTGGSTSATGTGGSATTTTGTSTSSGSGSTTSTGTGMMMGACTNAPDLAIVQTKNVKMITEGCGKANIGNDAKTKECIKMGTGLSDPCVTCFGDNVACVISKCFADCSVDSGSAKCTMCRATNCDPAFQACSGLPTTAP